MWHEKEVINLKKMEDVEKLYIYFMKGGHINLALNIEEGCFLNMEFHQVIGVEKPHFIENTNDKENRVYYNAGVFLEDGKVSCEQPRKFLNVIYECHLDKNTKEISYRVVSVEYGVDWLDGESWCKELKINSERNLKKYLKS